jgi:nucleoside-diphosphate-sugar epimerase
MADLLHRALTGPRHPASGAGTIAAMQWVHARDVAVAVVLAGTAPGGAAAVLTIAGLDAATLDDVRAVVWGRMGPGRPGRGGISIAGGGPLRYDVSEARRVLGFQPAIGLGQGLVEALAVDGASSADPGLARVAQRPAR